MGLEAAAAHASAWGRHEAWLVRQLHADRVLWDALHSASLSTEGVHFRACKQSSGLLTCA